MGTQNIVAEKSNKRHQVSVREIKIKLTSGTITAKAWGKPNEVPMLALHGWLDNAASFDFLLPQIFQKKPHLYVVAIDLPGHGKSCHISSEMYSSLIQYVSCVLAIIEKLDCTKVHLLGHSMGAAIAVLVAGAKPEKIEKLILLESNGPLSKPEKHVISSYRTFLDDTFKQLNEEKINRQYTPSHITKIIKMRQKASLMQHKDTDEYVTNKPHPFSEPISLHSARTLVERNMKKTDSNTFLWTTDPMLRVSSSVFFTEKQVLTFIKEITAPVCCIFAQDSPIYTLVNQDFKKRFKYFAKIKLHIISKGGHHLHMNEPELVAKKISTFLEAE